jgi:hypothetical protein
MDLCGVWSPNAAKPRGGSVHTQNEKTRFSRGGPVQELKGLAAVAEVAAVGLLGLAQVVGALREEQRRLLCGSVRLGLLAAVVEHDAQLVLELFPVEPAALVDEEDAHAHQLVVVLERLGRVATGSMRDGGQVGSKTSS